LGSFSKTAVASLLIVSQILKEIAAASSVALRLEAAVNIYAHPKDSLKNVFSAAQDVSMIYAAITALVKASAVASFQL